MQTSIDPIKQRYSKLEYDRYPFLKRARKCSALTIPSLLPPDKHSSHMDLPSTWQSLGARGLNNLTSKTLLTLFPPNTPAFRFLVDNQELAKQIEQNKANSETDQLLSKREQLVTQEAELKSVRVGLFEAVKHNYCAGNVLLYITDKYEIRVFKLDSYVILRDSIGNVLEIITHEKVAKDVLDEDIQQLVDANRKKIEHDTQQLDDLDLFTRVLLLPNKKWLITQEIENIPIEKSTLTVPHDECPYVAIRNTKIDGENYGRSYIDEYIGDLQSAEALTKAIVQGAMAASRVVYLVHPNGLTDKEELASAENGAVIEGRAEDVHVLQLEKSLDFKVSLEILMTLTERLSYAFMLNSAVQRNAERVTAEEIRYMSQELETSIGGIYSILAKEMLLPLINLITQKMEKDKKLPKLPKNTLKPLVITGVVALGRNNDLAKLQQLIQFTAELAQVPIVDKIEALQRAGAGLSIDINGLVPSKEEYQQQLEKEQQQQMQNQLIDKGTAPAINAMSTQQAESA